jgi:hypothetical protein
MPDNKGDHRERQEDDVAVVGELGGSVRIWPR